MSLKRDDIFLLGLTILIGVLTGLIAIGLHDLLKIIQKLAYGYVDGQFLVLSRSVPIWRRVVSVSLGGLLAALAWYLLQKKQPLVSIKGQLKQATLGKRPSFFQHLTHALTQILLVGMGGPVGKEVAPRELGALISGQLTSRFQLSTEKRELMIASAAAAGLSAVYQTPIASFFFLFEGMKAKKNWSSVQLGVLMILVATYTARLGIAPKPTYQVTQLTNSSSTWLLALVLGLCLPPFGLIFRNLVQKMEQERIKKVSILWWLPLSMILVAFASIFFPEILGNGRDTVQAAFLGLSWPYALSLLIVKGSLVLLALKAGAYGGTLTPGFAMGSLMGLLIGLLFFSWLPNLSLAEASIIGAGTFLSVSMATPLTAIFLTMTFTGQTFLTLPPVFLSVGLAYVITKIINNKKIRR
ncbi:chloride channel protein [Streptococcus sp. sy018]|uniref:chloride channel protein n=1 Tax=Streptococcus sp. sy018 TaxID=2600147 RepID=UPI001644F98F|nr:chloride channel protein [Streptococcus sp. sy018]